MWVCEACERAPAAFLCKADAASLCSSCDADIHSANPLASRHHRVPILPISGCALLGEADHGCEVEEEEDCGGEEEGDDEAEAASWLLPHPVKNDSTNDSDGDGFLFGGGEGDEYLELVYCNYSCGENNQQQHNYGGVPQRNHVVDSVVPVQYGGEAGAQMQEQSQHFQPGLDFDSSKAGFSYNGSINQSVSVSFAFPPNMPV